MAKSEPIENNSWWGDDSEDFVLSQVLDLFEVTDQDLQDKEAFNLESVIDDLLADNDPPSTSLTSDPGASD